MDTKYAFFFFKSVTEWDSMGMKKKKVKIKLKIIESLVSQGKYQTTSLYFGRKDLWAKKTPLLYKEKKEHF